MYRSHFYAAVLIGLMALALGSPPAQATDVEGIYYIFENFEEHGWDMGRLRHDPPPGTLNFQCDTWLAFQLAQPGTYYGPEEIESIYFHFWVADLPYGSDWYNLGWGYFPGMEEFVTVPLRDAVARVGDRVLLQAVLYPTDATFDGDEVLDFGVKVHGGWPNMLINPNFRSYVILNFEQYADPGLDTDNDLVNNYDEMFTYYTNPFEPDTDGDGKTDYEEIFGKPASDPNNYLDTTPWSFPYDPPPVVYVDDVRDPLEDGSYRHPYDTIAEAQAHTAWYWDTIAVRDGTYTGAGNTNVDFAGQDITVTSAHGPEGCTIDCEGSARAFYLHNRESADALIQGFTILDGAATQGGGIYLGSYVNAGVHNCIVQGCTADRGGAIYAYRGSPTITNCRLRANTATQRGGAIEYIGPPAFGSSIGRPDILDCLITNNGASLGGGIAISGMRAEVTIRNCTLSANGATTGGGLYCSGADTTMRNCILWADDANTGAEIALYPFTVFPYELDIDYCDVQGGYLGIGGLGGAGTVVWGPHNITVNPAVVDISYWGDPDWALRDYHLTSGSPCIDAGDPSFVPPPGETDLDGNGRIVNEIVDMGAYEYFTW
jgi:hypothetical protein